MSILDTLKAQKTHIIYGVVIIGLLGLAYNLFVRKPNEIVKTEVVTKVVTKTLVKKVYIKNNVKTVKHILTTKPDGTQIMEVTSTLDLSTSSTSLSGTSKTNETDTTKTVTSYAAKYTGQLLYGGSFSSLTTGTANPGNYRLIMGARVGNLPLLINAGTSGNLSEVLVGLTVEL